MPSVYQELDINSDVRTVARAQNYSTIVKFINEIAGKEPDETPTSVEIFANGSNWYCQVRRGDKKTRPLGPYSKQQAERIRDARRKLIATRGTSRLLFE